MYKVGFHRVYKTYGLQGLQGLCAFQLGLRVPREALGGFSQGGWFLVAEFHVDLGV